VSKANADTTQVLLPFKSTNTSTLPHKTQANSLLLSNNNQYQSQFKPTKTLSDITVVVSYPPQPAVELLLITLSSLLVMVMDISSLRTPGAPAGEKVDTSEWPLKTVQDPAESTLTHLIQLPTNEQSCHDY